MGVTAMVLAFLIGVIAGLRTMMAPAAIGWAANLGWLHLAGTPLGFLGSRFTPWVFSALALVELVTDQLPATPSRTVPVQFGARVVSGAFCGAAIGLSRGSVAIGVVAGVAGAVAGTLGGAALRGRLAAGFGSDRPAALIEDAVALGGAVAIALALR